MENEGKLIMEKEVKEEVKDKEIKILIAVPVHSYIENECFKSIYTLDVPEGVKVDFTYWAGYTVAIARNALTDYSLQNKYDYTLWVDSDIVLPKDFLIRVYKVITDKKDAFLSCGYYNKKVINQKITELYGFTEDGKSVQNIKEDVLPKEGGVYEIQGCGFGCCLVKNSVMQEVLNKFKMCFEYRQNPGILVSEDLDFCNKAKSLGYKMYADVGLKCLHIGKIVFG